MSLRRILEDHQLLLLLAITLLGTLLRVGGVTTYWFNPDEGIYHALAAMPEWSDFWAEVAVNSHPPLYYLTLRGLLGEGDDPAVLRLPALVFGCLAIPVAFLGVRRLFGSLAGLLAAGLVAAAPGLVIQSQIVRPYTMMVALLGLGLYFLLRYLEDARRGDWFAAAGFLLAAVVTHYAAVMAEFAAALTLFVGALRGLVSWSRLVALAGALLPSGLVFVALYGLHLAPYFMSEQAPLWLGVGGLTLAYPHLFHDGPLEVWGGIVALHHYLFGPRLGAVATLLALVGVGSLLWRRAFAIPGFTLAALLPSAVLSLQDRYPLGGSRHSLYLAVALVPCVAEGLRFLLARRPWQAAGAATLLVLLGLFPAPLRTLLGTPPLRISLDKVTRVEVARPHADFVEAAREDGGVLILDKQTYFMLMPYLGLPYPHEVRDAPGTVGARRAARVHWGEASLLVSSVWNFNLDPDDPGAPTHLLGFLDTAAERFPDLELRDHHDAVLLFGGWGASLYARLEAFDRKLGEADCVTEVERARGFGRARLDVAVCLEEGARRAARSKPRGLRIQ